VPHVHGHSRRFRAAAADDPRGRANTTSKSNGAGEFHLRLLARQGPGEGRSSASCRIRHTDIFSVIGQGFASCLHRARRVVSLHRGAQPVVGGPQPRPLSAASRRLASPCCSALQGWSTWRWEFAVDARQRALTLPFVPMAVVVAFRWRLGTGFLLAVTRRRPRAHMVARRADHAAEADVRRSMAARAA